MGKHKRYIASSWRVYLVILDESGLACVIAEQPLIDEADTVEINDIVLIHNPVAKSAWIKELGCNFYIMAGGVFCKMLVVNAGEDESQIMENLPKFSRIGSLSLLSVLNSPNASKNYHYHFFGKLSVVGDSVYLPQKSLTIWTLPFTDQEGNSVSVSLFNDFCSQALRYTEVGEVFVFLQGCTKSVFSGEGTPSVSITPNMILWDAEQCTDFQCIYQKFANAQKLSIGQQITQAKKTIVDANLFQLAELPAGAVYNVVVKVLEFKNPQYVIYLGCPRDRCRLSSLKQNADGVFQCKNCNGLFSEDSGQTSSTPITCGKFSLVVQDSSECDVTLFGTQLLKFYKKLGMTEMVEKLSNWTPPYEQFIDPLIGKTFSMKILKKAYGLSIYYSVNDLVRINYC